MQQSNISPCPTMFCQCQLIGNIYSISQNVEVTAKAYILILLIAFIIMLCIKFGTEWFIFKDYYPLKQKSPVLCIMLILSICGQIVLYPTLYISNFFTNMFNNQITRLKFRSVQYGLQFSIYIIYLVRCLRITYAHETHSSRSKSLAFRLFQKQYWLALIIGFLSVLKAVVVLLDYGMNGGQSGVKHFALSVQLQIPKFDDNHLWIQVEFLYRSIITSFAWHLILIYCMWLHKSVNERYSMKNQLLLVILVGIITNFLIIVQLGFSITFDYHGEPVNTLLNIYCVKSAAYPNTQLIKMLYLFLILWISIIKPLREKKVYHVLLPTGRHYGFIKTMRDFLMEEEFLRVFTRYLQHLDERNENNINITLLQFWKKMVLLKLNRKQPQREKLQSIKTLILQVQDILFIDQSQLILHLQNSIIQLQQSITKSDELKQTYRQSINEKVDELQKMALERLDRIYMKRYSQTQSYQHLKNITEYYKEVNLNMIMLNLALIVDSQNEFT